MTRAELERRKEKEQAALKQKIEEQDRKVKDRTVTEDEYDVMVSQPNLNHETDVVQAKSVEEAISGLQDVGLAEQAPVVSQSQAPPPSRQIDSGRGPEFPPIGLVLCILTCRSVCVSIYFFVSLSCFDRIFTRKGG